MFCWQVAVAPVSCAVCMMHWVAQHGNIPLLAACRMGATEAVIKRLMDAHPASSTVINERVGLCSCCRILVVVLMPCFLMHCDSLATLHSTTTCLDPAQNDAKYLC